MFKSLWRLTRYLHMFPANEFWSPIVGCFTWCWGPQEAKLGRLEGSVPYHVPKARVTVWWVLTVWWIRICGIPKPYKWSLNGTEKRNGGSLRIGENPLWDAAQHLCCSSILWGNLFPKGFWRRQVDLNHQRAKQKEEQLLASRLNLQSPLRTVPLNGDVKNTLGNPL